MHLQILLALVTMAFFGSATTEKPNCERTCGDVDIPFPFGSEGCYHNAQFNVICDRSSDPPIPYLGNSKRNAIIKNISTENGEVEMMMFVAKDCYDISGPQVNGTSSPSLKLGKFQISPKNRFVAIGCDTYAYLLGTIGNETVPTVSSGCISRCNSSKHITNGSCSGVGCCEIAIPKGMSRFAVTLKSFLLPFANYHVYPVQF